MSFLLAVAVAVVAVVAYIALRNARDFSDANEVVPGVASSAPKSWAGAHTPEARMHRRLRDAVSALDANASLDDPALAPVRTAIQQEALAVDQRLIAVAALPKVRREDPLRQVEKAVQSIEGVVASVVDLRGPSTTAIEQGIQDVKARMLLVEAARAELEALTAPSSSLDALRDRIDDDAAADPAPPRTDGQETD